MDLFVICLESIKTLNRISINSQERDRMTSSVCYSIYGICQTFYRLVFVSRVKTAFQEEENTMSTQRSKVMNQSLITLKV